MRVVVDDVVGDQAVVSLEVDALVLERAGLVVVVDDVADQLHALGRVVDRSGTLELGDPAVDVICHDSPLIFSRPSRW